MIASLPPAKSNFGASFNRDSKAPSSSFTEILKAWKVRVAGWILSFGPRPTAFSTIFARCAVVSIGPSARSFSMARATRPAS